MYFLNFSTITAYFQHETSLIMGY